MLSVHCIFLIKFYITRNQYVRRTRQFCPKWPILRRVFQKILIYIAYTLLPYRKHVHPYQKQLETKIYWVRKIFKCLGRVFLGISHFTGECALCLTEALAASDLFRFLLNTYHPFLYFHMHMSPRCILLSLRKIPFPLTTVSPQTSAHHRTNSLYSVQTTNWHILFWRRSYSLA